MRSKWTVPVFGALLFAAPVSSLQGGDEVSRQLWSKAALELAAARRGDWSQDHAQERVRALLNDLLGSTESSDFSDPESSFVYASWLAMTALVTIDPTPCGEAAHALLRAIEMLEVKRLHSPVAWRAGYPPGFASYSGGRTLLEPGFVRELAACWPTSLGAAVYLDDVGQLQSVRGDWTTAIAAHRQLQKLRHHDLSEAMKLVLENRLERSAKRLDRDFIRVQEITVMEMLWEYRAAHGEFPLRRHFGRLTLETLIVACGRSPDDIPLKLLRMTEYSPLAGDIELEIR